MSWLDVLVGASSYFLSLTNVLDVETESRKGCPEHRLLSILCLPDGNGLHAIRSSYSEFRLEGSSSGSKIKDNHMQRCSAPEGTLPLPGIRDR